MAMTASITKIIVIRMHFFFRELDYKKNNRNIFQYNAAKHLP